MMKKSILLFIFISFSMLIFAWIPSERVSYDSSVFFNGYIYHIWTESHDDKFVTLMQGISPQGIKKWESPIIVSHELGTGTINSLKYTPRISLSPDSSLVVAYKLKNLDLFLNKYDEQGAMLWANPLLIMPANSVNPDNHPLTVQDNGDIIYSYNLSGSCITTHFISSTGEYIRQQTINCSGNNSITKRGNSLQLVFTRQDSLFYANIENNQITNPVAIAGNCTDFIKAIGNESGELIVINLHKAFCLNEDNSLKWNFNFSPNERVISAVKTSEKLVVFFNTILSPGPDSSEWTHNYCFINNNGEAYYSYLMGTSGAGINYQDIYYYEYAVAQSGNVYIMNYGIVHDFEHDLTASFPCGIGSWDEYGERRSINAFGEYCIVTTLGPVYGFQQFAFDDSLNYLSNSFISEDVYANTEEVNLQTPDINLYQNYPNPFNPSTVIAYELKQSGDMELSVYNLKGQLVKTLKKAFQTKGRYEIQWDGKDMQGKQMSSGVYFYQLKTKHNTISKKCLMIK